MNILHQTLGLVSERDSIRLADGLVIEPGYVVDTINWARHRLRGPAEPALRLLAGDCQVFWWLKRVRGMGISTREACSLLDSLNQIGGLQVSYSGWRSYWWRLQLRLHGVALSKPAKRYPATFGGLLRALLRSIRQVFIAVLGLLVLAYGAGLLSLSFILAQVLFVLTLLLSTAVHEGWHVWQARRFGASACIVVRGTRIGVLHGRLLDREEVISALVGPISGSAIAFVFAVLLLLVGIGSLAAASVAAVGFFHWVSWLPYYGDGQAIRKYWRRYATNSA